VSYNIALNKPTADNDPTAVDFTKQQIFARLGIAY
jgi:hypothetical protein